MNTTTPPADAPYFGGLADAMLRACSVHEEATDLLRSLRLNPTDLLSCLPLDAETNTGLHNQVAAIDCVLAKAESR